MGDPPGDQPADEAMPSPSFALGLQDATTPASGELRTMLNNHLNNDFSPNMVDTHSTSAHVNDAQMLLGLHGQQTQVPINSHSTHHPENTDVEDDDDAEEQEDDDDEEQEDGDDDVEVVLEESKTAGDDDVEVLEEEVPPPDESFVDMYKRHKSYIKIVPKNQRNKNPSKAWGYIGYPVVKKPEYASKLDQQDLFKINLNEGCRPSKKPTVCCKICFEEVTAPLSKSLVSLSDGNVYNAKRHFGRNHEEIFNQPGFATAKEKEKFYKERSSLLIDTNTTTPAAASLLPSSVGGHHGAAGFEDDITTPLSSSSTLTSKRHRLSASDPSNLMNHYYDSKPAHKKSNEIGLLVRDIGWP